MIKNTFIKKPIAAVLAISTICMAFTGCSGKTKNRKPTVIVVSSKSASTQSSASQSSAVQSETSQSLTVQSTTTESSATESSTTESSTTESSTTQSTVAQSTAVQSTESQSTASTALQLPVESITSTTVETPPPPNLESEYDEAFFNDTLFIGDSIFTGLYLYSFIDRANVAAAIGYTIFSAQQSPFDPNYYSGCAVDYARDRAPKKIVIMLGTNSLSPETNMDVFENGYSELVGSLQEVCPDAKICAVSVPPITADNYATNLYGTTNAIIDTANERIKSLCGERGVVYYDLNPILKDENGYFRNDLVAPDGVHFQAATYPILLSGVQKTLKQ